MHYDSGGTCQEFHAEWPSAIVRNAPPLGTRMTEVRFFFSAVIQARDASVAARHLAICFQQKRGLLCPRGFHDAKDHRTNDRPQNDLEKSDRLAIGEVKGGDGADG